MGTARVVFDRWDGRYAERMGDVRSSAVRDLFAAASRPDMISLVGRHARGRTRAGARPWPQAAHDAIMHEGAHALQYGSSEGRAELRAIIIELMAETGVRLSRRHHRHRRCTAGARPARQDVHRSRATSIITEGPTYVGALQAFSAYQPDIRCIPMDDDGHAHGPARRGRLRELGRGARSSSTRSPTSRTRAASRCRPSAAGGCSSSRASTTSRWSRTTPTAACASRAGTSSRCVRSTTRSSTWARSRRSSLPGCGWAG